MRESDSWRKKVMTYSLFLQNESNERRDLELWLTTIPT